MSSASRPATETGAHVPSLDGVRGIAVAMVVISHFLPRTGILKFGLPGRLLQDGLQLGAVGVDIFFVLSGFLITGILLRTKESPEYFKNFYIRRSLRIFPLYYFALAVTFVVLPWFDPNPEVSYATRHQIWFWTYLTNFLSAYSGEFLTAHGVALNHFWSLAVEEQFYILWPAIIYFCRNRRQVIAVSLALIAISFVSRAIEIPRLGLRPVHMLTWCRFDPLAAGAILAALRLEPEARAKFRRVLVPVGLLAGAAYIVFGKFDWYWGLEDNRRLWFCLFPLPALLGAAAVEHAIGPRPLRFLSSPLLVWLGNRSYGIYVYHGMIRLWFSSLALKLAEQFGTAASIPLSLAIGIGVTLLMAELSFRWLEWPINSLKSRFAYSAAPDAKPAT